MINLESFENQASKVSPLQLSRLCGAEFTSAGHARLVSAVSAALGQLSAEFKKGRISGGKTKDGEYSATATARYKLTGKSNFPLQANALCGAIVKAGTSETEDGHSVTTTVAILPELREWLVSRFATPSPSPASVSLAPAPVQA